MRLAPGFLCFPFLRHTDIFTYFLFILFSTLLMNVSRMKKLFAGMSAVAISLTQMGTVFAAYSDVPAGVWYEDAVDAFTDAGYLDSSQTRFRGGDNANRAEFTKLVVELNGGILGTPPAVPSFDDVLAGAWYYGYMEEAGKEGWVKGDNNCYGSHPCYARPSANINRAEAAALIVRAFGLDATGDAPSFVDVPSGQWYTSVVQTAADHCVLQGDDSTGRARPSDFMNRAEMVVMLYRVDMGLTFGVDCGTGNVGTPMISDIVATSASTLEVEFNVDVDMDVAGEAGRYMVTGFDDIDVDSVDVLDDQTVELTLASTTDAGEDYTLSVEDMETAGGETFSDSMDFTGYSEIERGDGTLEVSVASTNPAGDTVPQGAVGVVMASVDLTATCEDDVIVSEITVLHEGFGPSTDISGVYAAMDGARVTRKRAIDQQDQTADLRFTAPLVVDACDTVTLDLVSDFSTSLTAASEHNLAIELPSDFQSNALDVDGNFPIRGNTFRVAAVTSGTVTVSYRTVSPDEVDVGDTNRVLGKFELSTNSVEDQTIYSMTLEQNGSASDADLENIYVRRTDGTVLTNKASTSSDFVTLVFDPPFTILEGDNITFEVVGDIAGGASDTVIFHFEESSDLFAVGSLYGYGVNGQLYGSQVSLPTETTSLPDTVTIQAGEFTLEVNGPVQQKYTRDDNDAVLANILMATGGEDVDIKDLFVAIQAQTSTGGGLTNLVGTSYDNVHEILEDVEIRNKKSGQTISGVRLTGTSDFATGTASTASYQIYRFDDFVVNGNQEWELRVDFIDNGAGNHPTSGDRFRAHVCTQTTSSSTGCDFGGLGSFTTATTSYNMKIEGLSTGDAVTDVRPGGTVTGNFHRIATPELNIAVRSIGTSDTAVKNSKNVQLLRFEARAGEAEDILFTKAIFRSESGSLLNGQNYALWVDTDNDGVVDTILEKGVASQSSQVTFDELAGGGYVIPAEETVMFEVHSDISASLVNNDLLLAFDTGSSVTYIEAEEVDDGSSLSGIKTNSTCSSTCNILVTTTRSKLYSLVNQGDLFVSKDTTPVRSRQLLGGTLGDSILRLNFRAQNEDIEVTDLQLASSGSNASSIDRLELYKDGETTAFAYATVSGCGSDDVLTTNPGNSSAAIQTFCVNMESRQLVVPEGQNLDVIVRPRMKSDDQGATVNQDIELWVPPYAVSSDATGSGAVRARGAESSSNLIANDGAGGTTTTSGEVFIGTDAPANSNSIIRGSINDVVLAKITTIANASPDADNTNVPTGVSPIGQFRFTAATNSNSLNGLNKATLSGVIFNVVATNVLIGSGDQTSTATSDFKFYNKADSSTKQTCKASVVTASGSFTVQCDGLKASTVDTSLDSGASATYVLEGDIIDPNTSTSGNSNLQVSLQDFTSRSGTTFSTSTNHVHWLDEDTSSSSFYWIEYSDTQIKSTSYKS